MNNLDTGAMGDGSLRGEIAAAQSGDTINFAPNLDGQTITLTAGTPLTIAKNLTIDASNLIAGLTISGNHTTSSRGTGVFVIDSAAVTLTDLTVSNGAGNTVVVQNNGNLIASGCNFSHNAGDIFVEDSTATFTDCQIDDNTSNSYGIDLYGGDVTLNDCDVSGNTEPQGAAIYVFAGNLTVTNTSITANVGYSAGAIYYAASPAGVCNLTNDLIANNQASEGPGGLYIAAGVSTVSMTNCTVSGNSGVSGGGFLINGHETVTLTNCTVSDNSGPPTSPAEASGGLTLEGTGTTATVMLTLINCTVAANTTGGRRRRRHLRRSQYRYHAQHNRRRKHRDRQPPRHS